MRFLLAVALLALGAQASEEGINPIRRVVNLMQKMQEEIEAEGKKDEEMHEKFQCYCKGNNGDLADQIAAGDAEQAQNKAEMEAKAARASQLKNEVAQHKQDRKDAKAALEEATSIREKENAEFQKNNGDLVKNIGGLAKAIDVLGKATGKAALVQLGNSGTESIKKALYKTQIADTERNVVLQFLQSPYGDYQASSGEIVGILKAMKDQMEADNKEVLEQEESAQANYEELRNAKQDEIKAATQAIEKKQQEAGEAAVASAEAEGAMQDEAREAAANRKFLANLDEMCKTKQEEYDLRTKTRNEEIVAVNEAIQILNNDDSQDIFKGTLSSPDVAPGAVSLLQRGDKQARSQAMAMLSAASKMSTSGRKQSLALLSQMLRTGKGFEKVVKMIDDMVNVLDDEQKTDDSQRTEGQKLFEENQDTRKELTRNLKGLQAKIDDLAGQIKALKEEIATLKEKIESNDKAVVEATEQRKEESAEFKEQSVLNTAAFQILKKAKNRLNKFYNPKLYVPPPVRELTEEERIAQNMGEVLPTDAPQMIAGTTMTINMQTNFLQKMSIKAHNDDDFMQEEGAPPPPPETMDAGHKKNSKSGGVLGLMDMLIKEIEVSIQEAEHDEKTAQAEYEGMMADAKATREADVKSLTDKESNTAEAETMLQETKEQRTLRGQELEAANEELQQLKASYDWLIENYDARKTARAQEREALVNAKAVLSGADYE